MPSLPQLTTRGSAGQVVAPPLPAPQDLLPDSPAPRGLYIHVPFCRHKCGYCDFYSLAEGSNRHEAFAERLLAELDAARDRFSCVLETIFVGGGTPTLLAPGLWSRILVALAGLPRCRDLEFTIEANPETVSDELLATLVAGGVNRMSLGAQSFDTRMLAVLERSHDPASVGRAVAAARRAGIGSVNLDLIFAVPGEGLDQWRADLDTALALEPDHLSCYGLVYEPGTALTAHLHAGRIARADQDLEARMYESTIDRLDAAGFEHYEISNWARPGHRCRHNLLYWTNAPWWALGPGAAGHAGGVRWKNLARLSDYLASRGQPAITDFERLDEDGTIGETFMLGLRLVEGLDVSEVSALLERGTRGGRRRAAINEAVAAGLLEHRAGRMRFTRRGLLLADTVLSELI